MPSRKRKTGERPLPRRPSMEKKLPGSGGRNVWWQMEGTPRWWMQRFLATSMHRTDWIDGRASGSMLRSEGFLWEGTVVQVLPKLRTGPVCMDLTVVRAPHAKLSYPWHVEKAQDCQTQLLCHCIAIPSRCNLRHATAVQPMAGFKGTKEGRCRHRSSRTHAIRHACKRKASPTTKMRIYHPLPSASFVLVHRKEDKASQQLHSGRHGFFPTKWLHIYIHIDTMHQIDADASYS